MISVKRLLVKAGLRNLAAKYKLYMKANNFCSSVCCLQLEKQKENADSEKKFDLHNWLEKFDKAEYHLPRNITKEDLTLLENCASEEERLRILYNLYKKEVTGIVLHQCNAYWREKELMAKKSQQYTNRLAYQYTANTLFSKSHHCRNFHQLRFLNVLPFSVRVVLDCSISSGMTYQESCMATEEIHNLIVKNYRSHIPFNLSFTSFDGEADYSKFSRKRTDWNGIFYNVTSQHYLDVFPRDKLIYLTSDSPEVMDSFDGESIYVIGNVVDFDIDRKKLSYSRARKAIVRTQRLPIISCQNGSAPRLDMVHVLSILHRMQLGKSISCSYQPNRGKRVYNTINNWVTIGGNKRSKRK